MKINKDDASDIKKSLDGAKQEKRKTLDEEIVEKLSAIEHTRWSGWQEYLHNKCIKNQDGSLTIPAGYVDNLERLIKTTYNNLTEKEKESDRDEARKSLRICAKHYLGEIQKNIYRKRRDGYWTYLVCDIDTMFNR